MIAVSRTLSLEDPSGDRIPDQGNREAQIEFVRLHCRALIRQPAIYLILALALAGIVHPSKALAIYVGWVAAMVLVEVVRASYAYRILKNGDLIDPATVHWTLVFLALLSGLTVSSSAVLFLPKLPLIDQAILGAVLFAIPAAGVAVSQSSRQILTAYALAILVPAVAVWAHLHPTQTLPLAVMTVLYAVVLILVAADSEHLLRRAIDIRHERDALVRELELRNNEISEAVQKAEQLAKSRARVLAAASHDLRQPLHALSLYSAVLETSSNSAVVHEAAHHIGETVRSLDGLLGGLLDFSRLSSGDFKAQNKPVDLKALLEDVCREYREVAAQKGLRFQAELEPLLALTDALAITRITRNLIDNAIKYTERGEIRVTLEPATQPAAVERQPAVRAKICVSDTGCGISRDDQERIFEEFYQVGNIGRDRSKGVGLGLAIVQRLSEHIGVEIEVQSELGAGSCFRVLIPSADVAQAHQRQSDQPESAPKDVKKPRLDHLRVLVVDDEQEILKATTTLLESWGISVWSASSDVDADTIVGQYGMPDVMILDLRLRGNVTGIDLAERLCRGDSSCQIAIMTGDTIEAARLEKLLSARENAVRVLRKPLPAADLMEFLTQCGATQDQPRAESGKG